MEPHPKPQINSIILLHFGFCIQSVVELKGRFESRRAFILEVVISWFAFTLLVMSIISTEDFDYRASRWHIHVSLAGIQPYPMFFWCLESFPPSWSAVGLEKIPYICTSCLRWRSDAVNLINKRRAARYCFLKTFQCWFHLGFLSTQVLGNICLETRSRN